MENGSDLEVRAMDLEFFMMVKHPPRQSVLFGHSGDSLLFCIQLAFVSNDMSKFIAFVVIMSPPPRTITLALILFELFPLDSVTKLCPLCNLKTIQAIFTKFHININQH